MEAWKSYHDSNRFACVIRRERGGGGGFEITIPGSHTKMQGALELVAVHRVLELVAVLENGGFSYLVWDVREGEQDDHNLQGTISGTVGEKKRATRKRAEALTALRCSDCSVRSRRDMSSAHALVGIFICQRSKAAGSEKRQRTAAWAIFVGGKQEQQYHRHRHDHREREK